MGKWGVVIFSLLFFSSLFLGTIAAVASRTEGSEEWGYVEVRPSKPMVLNCINFLYFFPFNFLKRSVHIYTEAHMFWWLYRSPYRVEDASKPWPIILWLQGGPVIFFFFFFFILVLKINEWEKLRDLYCCLKLI
jgi:serine carboxypeptidase 1